MEVLEKVKYSISGNQVAYNMIRIYLLMNRKLKDGRMDENNVVITGMTNGGKVIDDSRNFSIELINPDRDTVKNLAKIIRRTI